MVFLLLIHDIFNCIVTIIVQRYVFFFIYANKNRKIIRKFYFLWIYQIFFVTLHQIWLTLVSTQIMAYNYG